MSNELIIGSGGGGGCFPSGTLVHTPAGEVAIETLRVGDSVVSFDPTGTLCIDIVEKVHVHPNELVKTYYFWDKVLRATPNHWVLNQYNSFVEVDTLTVEDCAVDFMNHLKPLTGKGDTSVEDVYNLTVSKNHTFIANGFRVHNGGKGVQKPVIGSGGGGGDKGGGGAARQSIIEADSLSSKQYARVLDLLCEGEIEGLVDGYKSIYFDGTPLMASDGNWNFNTSGLSFDLRTGTQNQTPMTLFNSQETEVSTENREVTTGSPYTFTVTDSYIDYIRLNLVTPRLSYTDTTNGDVSGSTLQYKVSVKQAGGSFQDQYASRAYNTHYVDLVPDSGSSTQHYTVTTDYVAINVALRVPTIAGHAYDNEYVNAGYRLQYKANGAGTWVDTGVVGVLGASTTYNPGWTGYNSGSLEVGATSGNTFIDFAFPSYGAWDVRIVTYAYGWRTGETFKRTEATYYDWDAWTYGSRDIYYAPYYPVITSVSESNITSSITISGKCSNPYRFSYAIYTHGMAFPIDIKVTRITADSGSQYLQNKLILESYTKILTEKLSYPNSALAGLQLDATQFTNIPSRTYDMYLMKVKIPYGYNPSARTYPSIWDGTFITAWSDNPAWVFYDLCTNKRYGLGNYIQPEFLDVFQLYTIAKYCDELVPDGYGGYEPRYTCNLYIQGREEAYKVISNLAALFSSIVYWGLGTVNILSDMEDDPSFVFTNANVEEGVFNYSTGSLKNTHTVALVSYIDKTNGYKPAIEYVEDTSGVEKYGIKEVEVVAYGCTSRGQAHRLGRRMLLTEKLEGELVSFKTGINAAYCTPGAVIRIIDNTINAGNLSGGRLVSFTASSITVDRPLTLKAGVIYSLTITLSNGQVKQIPIFNPLGEIVPSGATATYTTLTIKNSGDYLQGAAVLPISGSVFVMSSSEEGSYAYWRVLGVKEADDLIFEISCIKYEPTKFVQIETGIDLVTRKPPPGVNLEVPSIPTQIPNPLYILGNGQPEYIDNIVIAESLYRVGKADIATRVNVSWQAMPEASEYRVRYKQGINNWVTLSINVPYFELDNAIDGQVYNIELRVANIMGKLSSPVNITHTVVGKLAPPSDVTGLTVSRTNTSMSLQWNSVTDIDLDSYEVRYYTGTSAVTWAAASILISGVSATRYDFYTSGLATQWNFMVKAIDTTGHYSTNSADVNITITVPSNPTLTTSVKGADAKLVVVPGAVGATQLPIAKYDIVYGTSYGSPSGDIVEGMLDTSYDPITYASRQYWVKTYDIANNASAAISSTLTISNPGAPTGIAYYFKNGKLYVTWTAPTVTGNQLPISYYKVYQSDPAFTFDQATWLADVSDENFTKVFDWGVGITKKFWIVAVDTRGEGSGSFLGAQGTSSVTSIPPQAVTFGTKTQVGPNLLVTWAEANSSLPISKYEIRLNGNAWADATFLGYATSTSYTIPLSVSGTLTIRVLAYDTSGVAGAESVTTYIYTVPAVVTNAAYSFYQDQVRLNWLPPTTIYVPIDKYEIRQGTTSLGFTYSSTFDVKADWAGARAFGIRAIDTAGNIGTETTVTATVSAATAPTVNLSFVGTDLLIDYGTPPVTSSLPIDRYEIRRGGSAWGVGDTLVDITSNTTALYTVNYTGTGLVPYRVKAYDIVGVTSGAVGENSIAVIPPTINSLTAQAVDNNVLLYWTGVKGSLPIDTFEVRRGPTWATATSIGEKSGGFTTVFETVGGTYEYWLAAKDTAGNYSAPVSRSVIVNSPPDYIFKFKHDSNWNSFSPDGGTTQVTVTKTNCAIDSDGLGVIGPIYDAETWATHFSNRAWTTIQNQIDAGYTLYIQPSNTVSADYEEVVDYGTAINPMKISAAFGGITVAGTVNVQCYISYKLNLGDAWSTEVNATELFATTFRYVKVRINMAATSQVGIYKLNSLTIKLDAKSKNDSNSTYVLASDTNGTPVVWTTNINFIDITSITLQPKMINITGAVAYSISGTTCTATCTTNNLQVGDKFYASFTGATPPPAGTYTVVSRTATQFVFIVASGSSTGTVSVRIPTYALYDFQDAPNPTGFSIYLYDSTGARASGYVSWTAEGY